jgi:MerR family transcriptional regulator, light-induced transcriptional regulator
MSDAHQAIRLVSRRTGLSAHVIRVWEKRYGAVSPERTGTNRRLYSDEQIERLSLLRDITQNGHSIGHVAKLPTDKLRELARETPKPESSGPRPSVSASPAVRVLDDCVAAVKALDGRGLEMALKRAELELGGQGMLQRVVAPLAQRVGDLWRQAARPFAGTENAPVLVVASPAGQIHELGALLVGATAANLGWHVTYLGPSLPAAEIAGAARQNRARAVALSLVYPEDDPRLEGELTRLRESLPGEIPLLVGGRAAPAYQVALQKIGAILVKDLMDFGSALDKFRKPAAKVEP